MLAFPPAFVSPSSQVGAAFVANIHSAFNEFHESAMNNITSTLKRQGKLSKPTVGPFSV